MSSGEFVTVEATASNRNSTHTLLRFFDSLTLLKRISPVALVLIIAATASPQLFLWLAGEYSQCASIENCSTTLPFIGMHLGLTAKLLGWVALGSALVRLVSWALFEIAGQWAAQDIHRRMVSAVAHTRTTFFDENPSGRLINRLVRDFDELRTTGVVRISDTIYTLSETLCVSALIFLAHPMGALLIIPTLAFFFYTQRQVSPMLQRCATLKGARLSEVLHRETDVIEGARTFQLYGKEQALLERLRQALSSFIQINLVRAEIESWGRFWTATITSLYSFITLTLVGLAVHYGSVSSILGAVILTVVFRLSPIFSWLTWTTSYLIESIASARRVFEYVDLPNETSEELSPVLLHAPIPAPAAPLLGDIEFVHYTMSYRASLPPILRDLSVRFPYGKHIGIVGRTGSGKTSILQSLFRMVYVHGGDIRIAGQSIFGLPVEYVRSLFGVVPQDPYLFEGTVHSNLDRTRVIPPQRLEDALRKVGLGLSLSASIAEGGKNLSLGERQLLCLARVLVLNRPYVLIDEPTSSVDMLTDRRIQQVLKNHLSGRTVIAVAHRLQTLSAYDLVLELRQGSTFRMGPPSEILPGMEEPPTM
ncbi:MAG: ATP-binding cassette domain-containing protein [Proteobacteria bacterium]|nr:ATP-binding cassette domain-containing protein [Pseudomonadota bacterium]